VVPKRLSPAEVIRMRSVGLSALADVENAKSDVPLFVRTPPILDKPKVPSVPNLAVLKSMDATPLASWK
jgi:hypothetical protein